MLRHHLKKLDSENVLSHYLNKIFLKCVASPFEKLNFLSWLAGWLAGLAVSSNKICSTSPPGGNQVDGLPPAASKVTLEAPAGQHMRQHGENEKNESQNWSNDRFLFKFLFFFRKAPDHLKWCSMMFFDVLKLWEPSWNDSE